ncbi:hypothetical protein P7C70_g3416, partial [Phenoliferia sp. Uapishka_3]
MHPERSPPEDSYVEGTAGANLKAARVKNACTLCFDKKVRCDGAKPCGRCTLKQLNCVFAEGGNSRVAARGRKVAGAGVGAGKSSSRGRSLSSASGVKKTAAATNGSEGSTPPNGSDVKGKQEERERELETRSPSVGRQPVKQPFFRYFGLTAISPPLRNNSFRTISITLMEEDPAAETRRARTINGQDSTMLGATSPESTIDTFYELFENYLPYAPKTQIMSEMADGTLSEATVECMAALVSRMRNPEDVETPERHAERARALVIPHLALPSLDVVYALLLLAYHEHGQDRDSGLWSYSGMAIRMSIDLGLHKPFAPGNEDVCALRSRVFWAVFSLDRIISYGTGRPTTIPLSQIEVDLPPPRPIYTLSGQSLVDPFPWLCKLFGLLGQISDTVNAFSSRPQNTDDNTTLFEALVPFRQAVADFHLALPADLHFNIHNFQAYASANYSQVFILLSIWHQALHLALYEQGLYRSIPATGVDGDLSQSASISITDMICFADLVLSNAFLCTPVLSQPLLMGGRAAISQMHAFSSTAPPHKVEALRRSIGLCRSTLARIEHYWKGLSWHTKTLETLIQGGQVDVDLSGGGGSVETKDRGMVARARLEDVTRNWLAQALAADALTAHSASSEGARTYLVDRDVSHLVLPFQLRLCVPFLSLIHPSHSSGSSNHTPALASLFPSIKIQAMSYSPCTLQNAVPVTPPNTKVPLPPMSPQKRPHPDYSSEGRPVRRPRYRTTSNTNSPFSWSLSSTISTLPPFTPSQTLLPSLLPAADFFPMTPTPQRHYSSTGAFSSSMKRSPGMHNMNTFTRLAFDCENNNPPSSSLFAAEGPDLIATPPTQSYARTPTLFDDTFPSPERSGTPELLYAFGSGEWNDSSEDERSSLEDNDDLLPTSVQSAGRTYRRSSLIPLPDVEEEFSKKSRKAEELNGDVPMFFYERRLEVEGLGLSV